MSEQSGKPRTSGRGAVTWPNETDPVMPQREIKIKKETDVFLDE
jgi:hypothetical protein